MKNFISILLASFLSILSVQAQCPEITVSDLVSADCTNGTTSCDLCVGDVIELTVEGNNLPDEGCIDWFFDSDPSFDPYNGDGSYLGCGAITSDTPCDFCLSIEAVMVNAQGGEEDNEFVIINSGGGLFVDDLILDYNSSNNFNIPGSTSNDDVFSGGSCDWQFPSVSLMGCSTAIPIGPGDEIPPNALVVIFTSSNTSFNYDFSSLCGTGAEIYYTQSTCPRDNGAFTNQPSGTHTLVVGNASCSCDAAVSYGQSFGANGDYLTGGGSTGNSGTSAPPVTWSSSGITIESFVDPLFVTITNDMCNGGPYFIKGIVNPLTSGCTEICTELFDINVQCPQPVITGDNEICAGEFTTLTADGGDDFDWNTGDLTPSITVSPTMTTLYDVFVSIGECEDFTDYLVTVNPSAAPILSKDSVCENAPLYDLANLLDPNYTTGIWSGMGVLGSNFDPAGLGGQTIILTFDSDADCVRDTTTTIKVDVPAVPTLMTHTMCETDPVFDLSALVDPLYPTGTWSGTGVTNNQFTPTGLGGQTITLTFAPSNNCVSNQTTTITVNEPVVPTLMTHTMCETDPAYNLSALVDPFYPTGTWSGMGVTNNEFTPTGLGGQTITLTFDSDQDCVNNQTTTITVNEPTVPTLMAHTMCETDPVYSLSALVDPLYMTGTWSGTGVTNNEFTPTGLGGQTITLTFDSDQDCVNNQTTTVTVNAAAVPTLMTHTLCEVDPAYNLSALVDPFYPTGTWSGTGVMNNQFTPTGLGGQTITLTFDSDQDCVNNQTTTISVVSQLSHNNLSVSCNTNGSRYIVTFDLSNIGTSTPTIIQGSGTLNGNTFTSDSLSIGNDYSFQISNGTCPPITISGMPNCGCLTNAGNLTSNDPPPLQFCENETVVLSPALGFNLDLDDALIYVLYEGNSVQTGNTIATNTMPEFVFDTNTMTLGNTYFIAAVAGNNDSAGGVDLLDPCLSISNPIAILFQPIPTATFSLDSIFICEPGVASIQLSFTGIPPFQYQLSQNGMAQTVMTTNDNSVILTFFNNTDLELIQFEDANCAGNILNATSSVVVNPTIVIQLNDTIFNANDTYSVVLEITGGTPLNYSFSQSTGTWDGQFFVTDPVLCGTPIEVCLMDDVCPQTCYQTTIACMTNCTTSAGNFNSTQNDLCIGDTLDFVIRDLILDNDDEHLFFLAQGGNTPANFIRPLTGNQIFFTNDLMTETPYLILSIAGNDDGAGGIDLTDPCLSISNGLPFVFHALPTASLPDDITVCKGEETFIPVTLSGNAPFRFAYLRNSTIPGFGVDTDQTNVNIREFFTQPTQIIISDIFDDFCSNENLDTININIHSDVIVDNIQVNCEPGNQDFVVSFDVSGGMPGTYQIEGNNGNLVGNTFSSTPIGSNTNYEFHVFDANQCDTIEVAGTFDCSCTTFAGTIQTAGPSFVCGDELFVVTHDGNEVLENDDVLIYVLHDAPNDLSNILESNLTGEFSYNNSLTLGQTYYVSIVAANNNGTGFIDLTDPCLSISNSIPVIFRPFPVVDFSITEEICLGGEIVLNLNFTGNPLFDLTFEYATNGNVVQENLTFNRNNEVYSFEPQNPLNIIDFTLSEIESEGCVTIVDSMVQIQVNEPSINKISNTLCESDSLIIEGVTYNQSNPTDTIVLANSNLNGCDSIIEINLNFNSSIIENLDDELCFGDTIFVKGNPYHEGNPRGMETFALGNGCDSTVMIDLTFRPLIEVSILGGETICKGDTAYLQVEILNSTNQVDILELNANGRRIIFPNLRNGDLLPVIPDTSTLYEIFFVGILNEDCIEIANNSVLVEVSDLKVGAMASDFNGFNVRCTGGNEGSIQVIANGGAQPYTYQWNDGNTNSSGQNLTAGDYKVLVEDGNGCIDSVLVQLTEPQEIMPVLLPSDGDCATGEEASLEIANVTGGVAPFDVILNDELRTTTGSFPANFINLENGLNTIELVDASGCSVSDEFNILETSNITVSLGRDTLIPLGTSLVLAPTTSSVPDRVMWTPPEFMDCDTCLNPTVTPETEIEYTITVFDESGCSDSDKIRIQLAKKEPVYIPSAFSPNNDGINDFFMVFGDPTLEMKIKQIAVFDRWGNMVFQGSDLPVNEPIVGWDGRYRGSDLDSGVYVYFAEIEFSNERTKVFEGDITLQR